LARRQAFDCAPKIGMKGGRPVTGPAADLRHGRQRGAAFLARVALQACSGRTVAAAAPIEEFNLAV